MKQAITFVFKENWSKTRKYCIQSKLHDKHKHACKQRRNLPKISLEFFPHFWGNDPKLVSFFVYLVVWLLMVLFDIFDILKCVLAVKVN